MESRMQKCKSRLAAYWQSLTGDFNYSKDYFFGWDWLALFAGVKLEPGHTKGHRRWWNFYRLLSAVPFLVMCANAVLSLIRRDNLEAATISIQVVIALTVTPLRMAIICKHYHPLQTVRGYVNARQFGHNLEGSLGVRGRAFYRIRRIITSFWIIQCCTLLSFYIMDVSNHLLAWSMTTRNSVTIVLEKIIISLAFGGDSMIILVTMTVYMVLTGLRTELEVITESFGNVFKQTHNRVQLKLESTPGSSDQLERDTKRYFWKFTHEELNECIQLHQEFLSHLATIRPFLNATFFVVYYSTAMSLACGAFYVIYAKTFSLMVLHSWYLIGLLLLECAIFTRAVSVLTEMNESIGKNVYNLDWPTELEFDPQFSKEYCSLGKKMLTVMAITQQPLRINCFGLFEFTQERFTELVMMSYDLVSFFKSFV